MAYTAVPTVSTGELWTAANQNTYLRDNVDQLQYQWADLIGGWNNDASVYFSVDGSGVDLPNGKSSADYAVAHFRAIASAPTVYPIFRSGSAGNIWGYIGYQAGAVGEAFNTHSDTDAGAAETLVANRLHSPYSKVLTAVTAGDIVRAYFYRDSSNGSDTLAASVLVQGILVDNGT